MEPFDNIAGYSQIKEVLVKLRKMLLNLEDFDRAGLRLPRGVLLYGAPGVGKTIMARAIGADPLRRIELCSAACTKEDAADAIVNAFEQARNNTPSVLLIDEIDKIAEGSADFYMEGNDNIMKILLQELDGEKNKGVLIIATCNDYERMNSALIRSGRFDRIIRVPDPDLNDRRAIIHHYFNKIKMEKHVDEEYFAKITGHYSCAELECVINEAGILAKEDGSEIIELEHVKTAMNRMSFRALEGKVGGEKEKQVVATHEAGHALVALILSPDEVSGATIIPQGSARGYVTMTPEDGDKMSTVVDVENRIAVALAGAVAERLVYDTSFLSASDDFAKAFWLAHTLVTKMGAYGPELICPERRYHMDVAFSQELTDRICAKRTELITRSFARAEEIIRKHRLAFDGIVRALLARCSLTKDEMAEILRTSVSAA